MNSEIYKRPISFVIGLLAGSLLFTVNSMALSDPLTDGFLQPPASARPRVWWHWMNGNISEKGADLDLEWMKRVGIGGFQNFDIALETPQVVDHRLVYMSPEWKAVFRHAAERAEQLDLEMAIASTPGWCETGGPWVKPSQGMKKLVWSQTVIEGGHRFRAVLKAPPTTTGPFQNVPAEVGGILGHQGTQPLPEFYADAAVIAYRTPHDRTAAQPTATTSDGSIDAALLSGANLQTSIKVTSTPGKPSWLLLDYGTPQTMRSVTVATGAITFLSTGSMQAKLESSSDGVSFSSVADIPISIAPQQTASIVATTARYFRLVLSRAQAGPPDAFAGAAPGIDMSMLGSLMPGGPPGSAGAQPYELSEFSLSPENKINQFELKAGFGMVPDFYQLESPNRTALSGINPEDVIDITKDMDPAGRLDWTPPKGRWIVLRLGYSLTGAENHPARLENTGLEVDKLNRDDVTAYMNTYLNSYADFLGPDLMGKHGVRAFLNDSTEVGPQNWTDNMLAEFQKRRGYDPRPFLPTLTGAVIGNGIKSDAFLYDFRKTLTELTAENHYAVVAEIAHARGLITYGEALEFGRPSLGDDLEMRRYTSIPMAAMWTYNRAKGPATAYQADIRGAASVAHLYGQNLVAAESMTSMMAPWNFAPRDLKTVIDLEFALGVNRPVVHTSVHQPLVDKKPGLSLSIFGQYFNRNDTWAEYARPWVDYIARNAFLLQQGRFFADVAYFFGEEAPLTGLYAKQNPTDLPHGYAFDYVNAEILNHRLKVENGELVAPTGARYQLLYLGGSSQRMTVATLQRIHELVAAGAVVAGLRPQSSPGLADDMQTFEKEVNALWSSGETIKSVGLGKVIAIADPNAAMAALKVAKDFDEGASAPDADIMFVHRKLPDGDLYFVDNRKPRSEHLNARFRVTGKTPEIWHAETGQVEPVSYRVADGVTSVPFSLSADEALFVVFRKPTDKIELAIPSATETVVSTVDGPWNVSFETGRGAPPTVQFDQLVSWTQRSEPGIKYFSGAATYSRDFTLKPGSLKAPGRLLLDLGEVRDLAEVRLNGALIGAPWHAPYRVDATGAVKPGINHLEIKVVNTWVNRLIGDKQPKAEKITFTVIPTYLPDAPLRPSGLIGPVRVIRVSDVGVARVASAH